MNLMLASTASTHNVSKQCASHMVTITGYFNA